MLLPLLQKYGLSKREAKIYLSCLEFGEDVVSNIAKHAGENRVTTYSILKILSKKGFAFEINRNNKKYFSVISAKKLIQREKKKYQKLESALPEFLTLSKNSKHKANIQYYEGNQNVKDVFDDILKQNKEILVIKGSYHNNKNPQQTFSSFHKKRIQQKIPIKIIYSKTYQETIPQEDYDMEEKEFKKRIIIKNDIFDIENDIVLYPENKIIMTFFNKKVPSCLVLESTDMYKSLQSIFGLIWGIYYSKY
ncbi:MAG: hypothetical protein GXP45_07735 [bacterium]|nr:hypothetical protein [bacterium]